MLKTKLIGAVCVAALASSMMLFGCSSDEAADTSTDAASTEATTEAEPAEEAAEEAPASDYEVTIDDAVVDEDYEGNPVVVVTYSWVNNSEDATSADVALYAQCFQNGVQVEGAYVVDGMDSNSSMAEVKPGAGTTFQKAYILDDESDVTIEVTELISLDDTILAEKTVSVA